MILCDRDIKKWGEELVQPYEPSLVQPASLDLRLGRTFRVFSGQNIQAIDLGDPSTYAKLTSKVTIDHDWKGQGDTPGFVLHPGEFVLGGTMEKLSIPTLLVGRVEGKSSLGRLGLIIHATAGFFDPGFRGGVTLEMTNLLRIPIVLRPGLPICQMSFHLLTGEPDHAYDGRYQGDFDVAPSRY